MNRDPRLLYGADIRKRILDEVVSDIARLATRRKVGHLVSVGIGEFEEIAVYIRGQARAAAAIVDICLLYTSPSPRDVHLSRMPSSA